MGGATSTNRSGGDGAFDKVRRVSTALRGIHSQPQPKRKLLIIFLESRQPQPLRSLLIIFLLSTSPSTFFVLPSYRMRSSARRTRWRPCTRSSRPTSRPGRHRLPLLSRRAATAACRPGRRGRGGRNGRSGQNGRPNRKKTQNLNTNYDYRMLMEGLERDGSK